MDLWRPPRSVIIELPRTAILRGELCKPTLSPSRMNQHWYCAPS